MSDVKSLIENVKINPKIKQTVKDYSMFLNSLYELDNLIGNIEMKGHIVEQVAYLLQLMEQDQTANVMLNSLLLGPPGVGKTKMSIILSKIWYSMGFLKGQKSAEDAFKPLEKISVISLLMVCMSSIYTCLWAYKVLSTQIFIVCIILIIMICIVMIYLYFSPKIKYNNKETIAFVSRQDLVGQYVGWSAQKTTDVLTKNLGKVVFIDEAYSLINSSRDDPFGQEVLNTINQFLSEHPNEIIVIFAGYGDLISNRLMRTQPGLKRRFMWTFTNNGYNYSELYKIFLLQVKKDGWKVAQHFDMLECFRLNIEIFANYAGDTERVLFYAKLDQSKDRLTDSQVEHLTLSEKNVHTGMMLLKKMMIIK